MDKWFKRNSQVLAYLFVVTLVVVGFLRIEQVRRNQDAQNAERRAERTAQINDLCETAAKLTIAARAQVNLLVDTSAREADKSNQLTAAEKADNRKVLEEYRVQSLALTPPFDCDHKKYTQIEKEVSKSRD